MASNQDINELIRLLVQQQQQQGVRPSPAFQPQLQSAPQSSSNTGAAGSLESAVFGCLSALSGSSAGRPNGHAPLLQVNSTTRPTSAVSDQQQLLQTARQLSAINPSLAAAVAECAMSLEVPQPQYSQQGPISSMGGSNSINPLSNQVNTNPPSQQNVSNIHNDPRSSSVPRENTTVSAPASLPAKPISLLTLQGWSLEKLESYKKQLQDTNQPVPRAVDIVIEDIKRKREKHEAKLAANRKSASTSRAKKLKLIEELSAANAKLRYQALLLSYLPDAVVALGLDGKIKFCSVQLERMLGLRSDELVGNSIEAIMSPDSHDIIRKFINDVIAAEAKQSEHQGQSSSENSSSGDNAVISRSSGRSGRSFPPLYEVNVDKANTVRNEEYLSYSSGNGTSKNESSSDQSNAPSNAFRMKHKSSSLTDEDPSLKKKRGVQDSDENGSSLGMASDNASITGKNGSAKLSSSLTNYPAVTKKQQNQGDSHIWSKHAFAPRMEKKQESLSSAESAWQDSQNKESNESSSDGYAEDQESSSMSGESIWKKGYRHCPLAPSCIVRLISKNDSNLVCELTSSIRTRDEESGSEVVNVGSKSKTLENEKGVEKELLFCVRPVIKEKHLRNLARMPLRANNVNDSEGSTRNKDSSGSDKVSSQGSDKSDESSRETQLCKHGLPKKRKVGDIDGRDMTESSSTEKKPCI